MDGNAIVVHATEGMDLRRSGHATCGDGDLGLQWFQGSDGGKHNNGGGGREEKEE